MGTLLFFLGKFLQLAGLGTVTVAFLVGVGEENVTSELVYLFVGGIIFVLGYLVERRGSRPES